MNINVKLNVVLLTALILAIIFGVYYYRKAETVSNYKAGLKILQNPAAPVIDTFRDKQGQLHAQISASANVVPKAALVDSAVKRDAELTKIEQNLNLKDASPILEVTQENVNLRIAVLRLQKDSADKSHLNYSDKYLSFYYDLKDSTVNDLVHNIRLTTVKYRKNRLLNHMDVLDFTADDKRISFSGFDHFTVAIPQPLFGLTVDAKGTYLLSTGKFIPSNGVDARLGNFHLEARNYWSMDNRRFQQSISASYKLPIF